MALTDEKFIAFTTYKKDGSEVTTPVWITDLGDGKFGFYTSSASGKAKRLKNNPKVAFQPSNFRGKIKQGTSRATGTAVVVAGPERDAVYDKVVAKYGFQVKMASVMAKLIGWVKRKPFPYADRGVVVTPGG